jgi:2-octaprenyl-6-methoxyphenol hydroxylase
MSEMRTDYDVLIVGGGMVGASLAIALSEHQLRIGLLEAAIPSDPGRPSYDDRGIALAYGSQKIFQAMGLWDHILEDATPIKDIHISDRGHFGFSHLNAAKEGVEALGHVVTARHLGRHLLDRMNRCADVEVIAPARVIAVDSSVDSAFVKVEQDGQQRTLHTKLLVAADGGKSFIREQLEVPTQRWEYGQTAVVTNITPEQPHQNVAYERFTDSGPVALLPMTENRCALVWTVRDEQVDEVMAFDDAQFIQHFQERFGYRLGRFTRVGKRNHYPLNLLRAKEFTRERIAIIGNAAHTLHPIAGQGFNLGLRDVSALVDVILAAQKDHDDVGHSSALGRFSQWRKTEQKSMALATDGLARLFSNPLKFIRLGRNAGLLLVDLFPPLRRGIARGAMGLLGKLPRLSRGLKP